MAELTLAPLQQFHSKKFIVELIPVQVARNLYVTALIAAINTRHT